MVRVITQNTFDEVVKENMVEFEMSRQTAIQESIKEFESQGVHLGNIVIYENGDIEDHIMISSLKFLESKDLRDEDLIKHCGIIEKECDKGLAERICCTNHNGYSICMSIYHKNKEKVLRVLIAMLNGNPDPLDVHGLNLIRDGLLEPFENSSVIILHLKFVQLVCIRHEFNRQNVVRSGILKSLESLFENYALDVCRIWITLVQDDDIRVPFGKAHDHAREIVENHGVLKKINQKISNCSSPDELSIYLMTLSSLLVRNEYCQELVTDGGLKTILNLLLDPDANAKVVKESLRLIKALAGNDNVKWDIANANGVYIMMNAIEHKMNNQSVCKIGCDSLTAVCLRSPDNAVKTMECGGAGIITQIMKTYPDSKIQMSCANAIRNIVSRSPQFKEDFIQLDIEELLGNAIKISSKDEDAVSAAKAALRDLDLKVELKERWSGTKKEIPLD